MSAIATLDIVLGAKTAQLDRALLNEGKNVNAFRDGINDAPALLLFKSGASDVANAIPGIAQVSSSVSGLASNLSGAAAAAGPVGIAIAAGAAVALGGVVALGFAWNNVNQEMKQIDEITKAAQKLGMTFRDLSNVRLSLAETSGFDQGAIDSAMQRMQMGLADASSKQSGDLFDKLAASGLDAGKLLKMGPAAALEEISAKTRDMKNPTDQLVLAYELFGKQGAVLVTSLREGPGAMKSTAEFADKVGMNLTQAQALGVETANDAWGRLEVVATGAWRQISAEAAPVLEVIYSAITNSTIEFSGFLDFLPSIVDNAVYFAGAIYDAHEASTLISTTLKNIATMNWGEIGKDIGSALTFDTGQKNLDAINDARKRALDGAANKDRLRGNTTDSALENYDRQKQKQKELADLQTKSAEDQARAAKQAYEHIQDRFDAVREEIKVQKVLASMTGAQAKEQESAVRGRMTLEADLRAQGLTDFSTINRLTQERDGLTKQNADREDARAKQEEAKKKGADLAKEFAAPQAKLIDKMQELESLRQNRLINQDTFAKASQQAYEQSGFQSGFQSGPRGAVSAQSGSVEAYKLLLDREKGADKQAEEAARSRAAQLAAQERIATAVENQRRIRGAR